MLRSDINRYLESKGSEPTTVEGDQAIIDMMLVIAGTLSSAAYSLGFMPFVGWSAVLQEYAKVYQHTVDEGHALTAEGGYGGLLATKAHGAYIGEKISRLIGHLMVTNREFALAFTRRTGWVPNEEGVDHINQFDVLLENALCERNTLREDVASMEADIEGIEAERATRQAEAHNLRTMMGMQGVRIEELEADMKAFKEQATLEAKEAAEAEAAELVDLLRGRLGDVKADRAKLEAEVQRLKEVISAQREEIKELEW